MLSALFRPGHACCAHCSILGRDFHNIVMHFSGHVPNLIGTSSDRHNTHDTNHERPTSKSTTTLRPSIVKNTPSNNVPRTMGVVVGIPLGLLVLGLFSFLFYRERQLKLPVQASSTQVVSQRSQKPTENKSVRELPLRPPELQEDSRHELQVSTLAGHS